MRDSPQFLFSGGRIIDAANAITGKVVDSVSSASLEALRRKPADEFIQEWYTERQIILPFLKRELAEHDRFEDYYVRFLNDKHHLDLKKNPDRRRGIIFSLDVPFVGDAQWFRSSPTQGAMIKPLAAIADSKLTLYVPAANLNIQEVQAAFDKMLDCIDAGLASLSASLKEWPMSFYGAVANAINVRRSILERAERISDGLSFRPKQRANAPEIAVPLVRRQIRPAPLAPAAPLEQQYFLAEDIYHHILEVMQNMSLVLELSPKAFVGLTEEAIRFHFLVQLNGQYEGSATGETFNGEGKSDIIIRWQGANVFVAECKMWEGPSALSEAIDQLQKYVTWRDTKTALVIFNRNKDFGAVIQKAVEVVRTHPQCKAGPVVEKETRFRFTFKQREDQSRDYVLTLMLFNIPAPV